jgi:multidrug efflux pump
MSVVGVLIGLMIMGKPFSTTMNGIAIVALSGIVVNNNIVLIDTFNRLTGEFPNLSKEDVIMKLINKDKSLVRRDLEARLARVKR